MSTETIRLLAIAYLAFAAVGVILAGLFVLLFVRRLQDINVPPDAGFVETLRLTPLSVVLTIDLLDLALDFLSAPVSWILLNRLGLRALREVSAIEALIPGTQLLPTLTLCWIAVRLTRRAG